MMSLYLCSTELLKLDRIEPVPVSYSSQRGVAVTLAPLEMHTIALNPYPFDQPSVTANVIFRRLTQATFKDSALIGVLRRLRRKSPRSDWFLMSAAIGTRHSGSLDASLCDSIDVRAGELYHLGPLRGVGSDSSAIVL